MQRWCSVRVQTFSAVIVPQARTLIAQRFRSAGAFDAHHAGVLDAHHAGALDVHLASASTPIMRALSTSTGRALLKLITQALSTPIVRTLPAFGVWTFSTSIMRTHSTPGLGEEPDVYLEYRPREWQNILYMCMGEMRGREASPLVPREVRSRRGRAASGTWATWRAAHPLATARISHRGPFP